MLKASMRSSGTTTRARSSVPLIDKSIIVPMVAFSYAAIVAPLIGFIIAGGVEGGPAPSSDLLNQLFWPAVAASAIGIAVQNRSGAGRLTWPPNIVWLFTCLALAIASALWAFKPPTTFIRSMQQAMLIASIALTPIIMFRGSDMMRALFLFFAVGVVLHWLIGARSYSNPTDITTDFGYRGFTSGKNVLGQFAGMAFLLAIHETLHTGSRRVLGLLFVVPAAALVLHSESKTSISLAFLSPVLAGFMLMLRRTAGVSAVIVLSTLTTLCVNFKDQLGFYAFHDPTFTGRIFIWDFASYEISRRPLLGWGYLSFWLVGPDGPSVTDAWNWVGTMPHSHNGYLDLMLHLGYVGFACFIVFVATTVLAIERVARRDPARAWLLLSLVTFIIFNNFLESSWMRAADFIWVVFLIVSAEAGRCWRLSQSTRPAYALKPSRRPLRPGPSRLAARSASSKEAVPLQQQ